ASAVNAIGCDNCLDQSKDTIRLGCFEQCASAYNAGTDEYEYCRSECTTFVFNDKCCNTACVSNTQKCYDNSMTSLSKGHWNNKRDGEIPDRSEELEAIRRDPRILNYKALLMREPPYDAIQTTEELRSLNPRAFKNYFLETDTAGELDKRVDPGKACCHAGKMALAAGSAALAKGVATDSPEEMVGAMVMVAFGAAVSYTCSKVYNTQCVFGTA
ncbi:hypothetical protein K490DRAFT_5277, partial [Saccharata proteae CBS 121410]